MILPYESNSYQNQERWKNDTHLIGYRPSITRRKENIWFKDSWEYMSKHKVLEPDMGNATTVHAQVKRRAPPKHTSKAVTLSASENVIKKTASLVKCANYEGAHSASYKKVSKETKAKENSNEVGNNFNSIFTDTFNS